MLALRWYAKSKKNNKIKNYIIAAFIFKVCDYFKVCEATKVTDIRKNLITLQKCLVINRNSVGGREASIFCKYVQNHLGMDQCQLSGVDVESMACAINDREKPVSHACILKKNSFLMPKSNS